MYVSFHSGKGQQRVRTHAAEVYNGHLCAPPPNGQRSKAHALLPLFRCDPTPGRNTCARGKKTRLAWPRSAIPVTFALREPSQLERTHAGPATCSVPEGPRSPRP